MRAWTEWFFALMITASVAVAGAGAVQHIASKTAYRAAEATADGYTVVVDAGHGGFDGGAVGTDTGVIEAELNLTVAKLVEAGLAAHGVQVVMTRGDAESLAPTKAADMAARREVLCREDVDLIVSVHMNKFTDRGVSGAMAYYMTGSEEGRKLAESVINAITDAQGRSRRLANPGDYFVIRECACPAVLVECGFLSNPDDERRLTEPAHQQQLADAIVAGVLAYLET